MKILVTGAAGFIGSHIVDHLIKNKHKIIALDDLSGGYVENVNKKAEFIKGSINDTKLLDKVFSTNKIDFVFHLAAYAAEGLSHFIRKFNYENNLVGSTNLIVRSIKYKIKQFVFTSSIAVYGSSQFPFSEKTIPQPEDPYGIAKYSVELDLKSAHEMFGLNYTIFRPHNVYGERQNYSDQYRNVIGIFMNNILHDKPMTIFGDGSQTRAFSYIDDVAPYIAKSIHIYKTKNETFNIGADKPYSILELARTVADVMGIKPYIKYYPARKEVKHAFSNHSKAKKIFGIKKTTDLRNGIKNMAAWVKKASLRQPLIFPEKIELTQNLPPSWKKII